jgi:micrococcal nuclease
MKKTMACLLTLLLCLSSSAEARRKKTEVHLSGVVQQCHDGDTCRVMIDRKIAKVRLAGVDTPEIKQKYGKEAQKFTEGILLGRVVDLKCDGTSWDRITCTVFVDGRNINQELVQNGWAYDSAKFSNGVYRQDEILARSKRKGIWAAGESLTSPYCFRHKTNKKCRVSSNYMP